MKQSVRCAVIAFGLAIGIVATSEASLIQIVSPDAGYLSSTTLIPILAPNGTDLTSITDGTVTVNFSDIREVHTVPGGGWATWGSPPNTETSTPRVLGADGYNPTHTLVTLTFSTALQTFGLEAEPDPFSVHNITATFFNGATQIGQIVRPVDGFAGARLFAGMATGGDLITSVVISSNTDFAIAQLRYDTAAVPEPGTLALFGSGLAFLIQRRRRKA